jgi:transcriptional regulator with XRE-family HTH domain
MGLAEIFARNLRRLRDEKEFTQEALAHAADLDRTYISSLERSVYSPTLDTVEDIAKALNVDPIALLTSSPRRR